MLNHEERVRLKKLLSEAVPLLCKNSLGRHVDEKFCVEAMIGITMDEQQVAIICFKETVFTDGTIRPSSYGTDCDDVINEKNENDDDDEDCQLLDGPSTERRCLKQTLKREKDRETIQEPNSADSRGYHNSYKSDTQNDAYYNDTKQMVEIVPRAPPLKKRIINGIPRKDSRLSATQRFTVKQEAGIMVEGMLGERMMGEGVTGEGMTGEGGEDEDLYSESDPSLQQDDRNWYGDGYHEDRNEYEENVDGDNYGECSDAAPERRLTNVERSGRRGKMIVSRSRGPTNSSNHFKRSMLAIPDGQSGSGYGAMIQGLCDSIVQQSAAASTSGVGDHTSLLTCHICQAQLSNSTSLRNHIRGTHLALKSARCNICGESFKWAMQMARHKKREHGDGSFLQIYNT